MSEADDLNLLRQIVAAGGKKYTAGNVDRTRYQRLVDAGCLDARTVNISDVEYEVTERGRAIVTGRSDGFAGCAG